MRGRAGCRLDSKTWLVTRSLGLLFLVVFWLATAFWVFKDARRRIEDRWLVTTATLLGLVPPFLGPFIYLNNRSLFTMSIGLRYFQTVPEQLGEPKDHLLMVATIIMTLPAVALFFAAQRYFVRGIVMTGLKM